MSALVATSERATELSRKLAGDVRIQVGEAESGFLPLVTTTQTLREARELYEFLRDLPGVRDVQLVSWTDDAEAEPWSFSDVLSPSRGPS